MREVGSSTRYSWAVRRTYSFSVPKTCHLPALYAYSALERPGNVSSTPGAVSSTDPSAPSTRCGPGAAMRRRTAESGRRA